MKIFWSWQNDAEPKRHRHFIKSALKEAIKAATKDLAVEDADRPALDHDTKNAKGAVEIVKTIMDKIAASDLFVADVTPIGETPKGKPLSNPNVMLELGWALSAPGPEKHIYILNTGDGRSADDLPFDIRHRLVMTYALPDGADGATTKAVKKKLVAALTYAIQTNLEDHLEAKAAATPIPRVEAKADDPSLWASAGESFSHHDSMSKGHERSILLTPGPRAYIRVAAAGWQNGPPSVDQLDRYDSNFGVRAPAEYTPGGNFGATPEGYVNYWLTGARDEPDESANVAMYFDDTGEFWVLHGTAIVEGPPFKRLAVPQVFGGWASVLHRANFFMDFHKASPVREVEVGIVGLKDVRWPAQFDMTAKPSRKPMFEHKAVDRAWTADRQRAFLGEAFVKLTNTFGLPKPTQAQAEAQVDQWDRDRTLTPPWV